MLKYVKGDLFSATEGYIVHGCNCQGVMGSGVALAIKNKYPSAYLDYLEYCSDLGNTLLGTIQYTQVTKNLTVANAFTQVYYGKDGKQYASYEAIDSVFTILAGKVYTNTPIHMPKIGCGLGGLKWEEVYKYLEYRLNNHDVTIYEL